MFITLDPFVKEHVASGKGFVINEPILSPKEMGDSCKMFSKITLKPGCSIGFHKHEGNGEAYCFLAGEGTYNENGTLKKVSAGDTTWCPSGESHGLENTGKTDLVFIALIINK